MNDVEYVITPQNDLRQLKQIIIEYESEPSRGLAHGVQKDAIQNSFGAREKKNEKKACKTWKTTFELIKIDGKEALVFWDEGTEGLTGKIIEAKKIEEMSAQGLLGPDERLGRFLTRFESGENIGAGIFGRGKLIFNCASENMYILVDSLRIDDNKYVAFDRFIENTRLKQPKTPLEGNEAIKFIEEKTKGILKPFSKPGTRITIFDLKPEISTAIKKVFDKNSSMKYGYDESFSKMIEETWWELLIKFNAQIFIRWNGKEHKVELTDPLKKIVTYRDKQENYRIFKKEFVPIIVNQEKHTIKELKFVVTPSKIDEDLRDFWIQRKRMKIGSIMRGIHAHYTITKRFCGYAVLEEELEDIVEKAESVTHYGFTLNKSGIKQIREKIKTEIEKFQQELGLQSVSKDETTRKEILDSLKEINQNSEDLGLLTDAGMGKKGKEIQILLQEIKLPNKNSLRAEIGDYIGPIKYKIKNNTGLSKNIKIVINTVQKGCQNIELFNEDIILDAQEEKDINVDKFVLDKNKFGNYLPLLIKAIVRNNDSNEEIDATSEKIWIGINPPQQPSKVKLGISCKFPRNNSRRVETGEVINNLKMRIKNETAYDLNISLDVSIRQCENKEIRRQAIPLFYLKRNEVIDLKALSEIIVNVGDVYIDKDQFQVVLDTEPNVKDRKCDIFGKIRLSETCEELNLSRYEKLDKCSIVFYLEVDPPGQSIFKGIELVVDPKNGNRSWYRGDGYIGYTCCLNIGHPHYITVKEQNISEINRLYQKEHMLTQAYYIAADNDCYKGLAEEFAADLQNPDISFIDASKYFDHILGKALKQILER